MKNYNQKLCWEDSINKFETFKLSCRFLGFVLSNALSCGWGQQTKGKHKEDTKQKPSKILNRRHRLKTKNERRGKESETKQRRRK